MKYIFILLMLVMCIIPVSAAIPMNVTSVGDSYITWEWISTDTLTNMSIDGYTIKYFDQSANTFTLSDLKPMESHTIRIYTASDSGFNKTNTTSTTSSVENAFSEISRWLLFLIGCICLFFAWRIERMLGFGALLIAFAICLASYDTNVIMLMLGVVLAFASIFVIFQNN